MNRLPLPIDELLPSIVEMVQRNAISILQAEPGAGKTTRVPMALVHAGLSSTIVLEPRRLAARMAASRVAAECGQAVGESVGYQIRFDQVGGPQTKLWYLTEGVLTKRLLASRRLDDVAVVVLDEFHERHLDTDIALALCRRLQTSQKLRLLIMSATLDSESLSEKLGGVPVLKVSGRSFPIDIRYTPATAETLPALAARNIESALGQTEGHVLAFLPGVADLRRTLDQCRPFAVRYGAQLLPLYADLNAEDQDAALMPCKGRKIICATNIAESSLTIEGVQAVVDSGLARLLMHSPLIGINHLRLTKISKASAIQRSGRAGRTGPGLAIRLFSQEDFFRRPEHTQPEILRADLAATVCQLAASGLSFDELSWIDRPEQDALDRALQLLSRLALFENGKISALGRFVARLPVHPRLGCFVVEASRRGALAEACHLAALIDDDARSTKDASTYPSDLEALLAIRPAYGVAQVSRQLQRLSKTHNPSMTHDEHALEKSFLRAFGDRVARRRNQTLLLCDGSSARLSRDSLTRSEFLVAVDAEEIPDEPLPIVRTAIAIDPGWISDYFPDEITIEEELLWNREKERVEQVTSLRYQSLVLEESHSPPASSAATTAVLLEKVHEAGPQRFLEPADVDFLGRVRFARHHAAEIPDPELLVASSLAELATGTVSFSGLRDLVANGGLLTLLRSQLDMDAIDALAPSHVVLASGRRARIQYNDGQTPAIASRLQDFFGMTNTPVVARGRVPLIVHLLAPNGRPLQMTTDLRSFWQTLYPQLRKQLSRRYPKHTWPEPPRP